MAMVNMSPTDVLIIPEDGTAYMIEDGTLSVAGLVEDPSGQNVLMVEDDWQELHLDGLDDAIASRLKKKFNLTDTVKDDDADDE